MDEWMEFFTRLGKALFVLAIMTCLDIGAASYVLWVLGTVCYANFGTWRRAK